tara:strand:- start:17 stop:637 length:621 start_codon:yes stop_codon:yes gene_type:complete
MFCEIKNLFLQKKNIDILYNITTLIKSGEITVIVGKNGSGKTSLLKCLNCLIKPNKGFINHKYNYPFPMLFQKPAIFDNTVKYNFEIVSKIKKVKPTMLWYKKFNLQKISNKKMFEISGGEQQKIFLSRIMSVDSKVVFMDEPNNNLDLSSDELLLNLLLEEKKKNKTIIISLHDINIVKKIADKIIVLDQGNIIFDGLKNNYFNN